MFPTTHHRSLTVPTLHDQLESSIDFDNVQDGPPVSPPSDLSISVEGTSYMRAVMSHRGKASAPALDQYVSHYATGATYLTQSGASHRISQIHRMTNVMVDLQVLRDESKCAEVISRSPRRAVRF